MYVQLYVTSVCIYLLICCEWTYMLFHDSLKLLMVLLYALVIKYVHVWGNYTKEQNYWIIEYA